MNDYCGASHHTGTFGIGDHGQYGYKELVGNGPHGGMVTLGVFRAQAAAASRGAPRGPPRPVVVLHAGGG